MKSQQVSVDSDVEQCNHGAGTISSHIKNLKCEVDLNRSMWGKIIHRFTKEIGKGLCFGNFYNHGRERRSSQVHRYCSGSWKPTWSESGITGKNSIRTNNYVHVDRGGKLD